MKSHDRLFVRAVTVDSPTAGDLDDAIWVKKVSDGWKIIVTISDVAEVVRKGSTEAIRAFEQAFTRYYPWGNDPMLSRRLAEFVLSLLPGQLRNTISFFISLTNDLEVKSFHIKKTRIKSRQRFSHAEVDAILDNPTHEQHTFWLNCFELAQRLLNKRRNMGALVVFDLMKGLMTTEEGVVKRIPSGQNYRAYLIVQELMILTNYLATKELYQQGVPLLFRNHKTRQADVRKEYLRELSELLLEPTTAMLEKLGREARHLLERARYGPTCEGHFALNLDAYGHWTSPIRRYADLVNHWILHTWLEGGEYPTEAELQAIADHINALADATRDQKDDVFRGQRINRYARANKARVLELAPGEFSEFVEMTADESIKFNSERAEGIIERIATDTVDIGDIARILFSDTTTKQLWYRVKEAALQWLRRHAIDTFAVYNTASTLFGLPEASELSYEVRTTGPSHKLVFHITAVLIRNEHVYRSREYAAIRRRDAEQQAILSLIAEIAGLPQEERDQTARESLLEEGNPKGKLQEICQKYRLAQPRYWFSESGPHHSKRYTCVVSISYKDDPYQSRPWEASNKRTAEHLAAADLLIQLPVELTSEESAQLISFDSNPINALQEWCQGQGLDQPQYGFKSTKGGAALFVCTVRLILDKEVKEWQGVGTNKKTAKHEAALAACKELLNR